MLSAILFGLGLAALLVLVVVERVIKPEWTDQFNLKFKTRTFGIAAVFVILSGFSVVGEFLHTLLMG